MYCIYCGAVLNENEGDTCDDCHAKERRGGVYTENDDDE